MSESHKPNADEKISSAEHAASNAEDKAVKSVHGTVVEHAIDDEIAGKEQSKSSASSSDATPEQQLQSSAPIIMMNVSDK